MVSERVELPPEIWQEIVELVCGNGRWMCDMSVRETLCSLQRTCRMFFEICTPFLYEHAYILSSHGLKSYLTMMQKYNMVKVKTLMIATGHSDASVQTMVPLDLTHAKRVCCLRNVNLPDYFNGAPLHRLQEWSGCPNWAPTEASKIFPRLKRMCLTLLPSGALFQYVGALLSLETLEDLILLRPETGTLDEHFVSMTLAGEVMKRKCDPHITVLNGLAKTIDNPGFSRIQRSNNFFDKLARLSPMTELKIYRLSTEEEDSYVLDGEDESPIMYFVEDGLAHETVWDYCRQEGRKCGQSTGLGLALVPY